MRKMILLLAVLSVGADKCPKDPCKEMDCPPGTHCQIQETWPPTAVCVPDPLPSPSPSPSPSPLPSPNPIPSPTPSPSPVAGCPVGCGQPQWLGVALRSVVPINPQNGKYLGKRYNVDSTAHTFVPACQESPSENTEWKKACQDQHWPDGPDFYMTLPGHFEKDRCDPFSGGDWYCHHKPEGPNGVSGHGAQVGLTTFWAVPPGAGPDGGLLCPPNKTCSLTINVQP